MAAWFTNADPAGCAIVERVDLPRAGYALLQLWETRSGGEAPKCRGTAPVRRLGERLDPLDLARGRQLLEMLAQRARLEIVRAAW